MSTVTETAIAENAHITSLCGQLAERRTGASRLNLAIISANPTLDFTAVAQLKRADLLILRSSTEALSKALEDDQFAEAICWAVEICEVTSLTLVGYSQAAAITVDTISLPANPSDLIRMHNEKVGAAKLKLKDDLLRFLVDPRISPLVARGRLSVHALFFLQENGTFLELDTSSDGFRPLV